MVRNFPKDEIITKKMNELFSDGSSDDRGFQLDTGWPYSEDVAQIWQIAGQNNLCLIYNDKVS